MVPVTGLIVVDSSFGGRLMLSHIRLNDMVESINVAQNDVSSEDVEGLAQMLRTCTTLKALDLSENDLQKLVVNPKDIQVLS